MAAIPRIPSLQSTLSYAAPDKAAEIRSAITGALKYCAKTGVYSFENRVETTFVLPWDINPRVDPQRLSKEVSKGIREKLLDPSSLQHLENSGSINWNNMTSWQGRPIQGGDWYYLADQINSQLEVGYCTVHIEWQFTLYPHQFQVNYSTGTLINLSTREMFELRRLAFAPLMPMKTEADSCSLFHAASLGLWGVHDRTQLLKESVTCTLTNPQAQINLYDRWSHMTSKSLPPTSPKPVGFQFTQWEAAKANIIGSPQLHIFTLSNIIQRPIIVYSHPESPVGGIYLPLLWEVQGEVFPCDSYPHLRNPLVLGFDCTKNHFVPLVTFKGAKGPNLILLPLVFSNGTGMPVHFLSDNQESNPTVMLQKLMFVDMISHNFAAPVPLLSQQPHLQHSYGGVVASKPVTPSSHSPTLACIMNITELPEVMDQLIKRFQSAFL